MTVRLLLFATLTLALSAGHAGATGSACPTDNRPNELVLVSGSSQTAQLLTQFASQLQVQLANTNGCTLTGNLAGYEVVFDAPSSGASGTFSSTGSTRAVVGTNSQGVATAPNLVANDRAGSYSVRAASDFGSVTLALTNTASGVASQLAAVGTTAQETAASHQFSQPLQARVVDANGTPVQGVTVSFAVVAGPTGAAGTFLGAGGQATAATGSDGVASSRVLVANAVAGTFTVTASVDGVTTVVVYTLRNHASAGALVADGGVNWSATVDTRYAAPLRARVLDADGQPVEGATVTFALAQSAAAAGAAFLDGATQSSAVTDSDGRATSQQIVANKVAGPFTATATTALAPEPLQFTLTNVAGPAAAIAAGAASGESAAVRARFPVPLAVTVTDAHGNPVPHAPVVFAAPARGANAKFLHGGHRARVYTNAKGIAVAPALVAGSTPGGYAVTATVAGTRTTVAFALVNEPRR